MATTRPRKPRGSCCRPGATTPWGPGRPTGSTSWRPGARTCCPRSSGGDGGTCSNCERRGVRRARPPGGRGPPAPWMGVDPAMSETYDQVVGELDELEAEAEAMLGTLGDV